MAGFGKRGLSTTKPSQGQRAAGFAASAPEPSLDKRPPPRVQSNGGLQWSEPFAITRENKALVKDQPGVYALMAGHRETDIIYIGGTKDLLSEYIAELSARTNIERPRAKYFCYAEALTPYEEAQKEITLFKRRHGHKPMLNSGF
ncbi:hypothetical protein V0U79_10170 [Hyphobacterium sp. HN65]|uniref:GIY-YIG domain-containing protein n=1 Tax=Hyphobacterium lacteum TaxID=3116575 RepID=A0ABU7LS51_9PROT|nr:hypothetical protein [Hyphobacterium sp. HN65]MEE2526735.1 hypothetical protein [Hyphobacterium sp. HN65]